MKPTIGFIGLGIMGRPMAQHILNAGFPLVVHNRSRPPVDALVELGATPASNPAELAEQCEIVISCLPDDEAVLLVWLQGENAAIPAMRTSTIGVDMSTVSPGTARTLAENAQARGVSFLDAPVTGGQWGAEAGTLCVMVGGEKEAYERTVPVFETFSKKVIHVGESGMGQTLKLTNQIAVTVTMQAVSEALLFGEQAGLDPKVIVEVLSAGAAGSWAMENLGSRIADRNFSPGFMVKLLQKDLRLLFGEAERLKVPLPGTALTQQLMRHLENTGEEKLGIHALTLVLERLANKD
jgi:3-hydroxyisobutyrate dehydrogenase